MIRSESLPSAMASTTDPVLSVRPLGFPWETADPFLFCAYHDDAYPQGNGAMGPAVSLAGRDIVGNDDIAGHTDQFAGILADGRTARQIESGAKRQLIIFQRGLDQHAAHTTAGADDANSRYTHLITPANS